MKFMQQLSDHEFSIVIPTFNDGLTAKITVENILKVIVNNELNGNIIIVDDSTDETSKLLQNKSEGETKISLYRGDNSGFGGAIRKGINLSTGDTVIIMMGDGSEEPEDILFMLKKRLEGYNVVFGNRFGKQNDRRDYPRLKYWANRIMNYSLQILFRMKAKDITNAFTAYNRHELNKLDFTSNGFELSIELPLKLIKKRKSNYTSVDVTWINRIEGESKMRLMNVGVSYWKLVLHLLFR